MSLLIEVALILQHCGFNLAAFIESDAHGRLHTAVRIASKMHDVMSQLTKNAQSTSKTF